MSELDTTSIDAMHWAEQLVKTAKENNFTLEQVLDDTWLVGWFANYWAAVDTPLQAKIDALQAERDGLKNVLEKVRDDLMLRAEDAPDGARVVAVGNGVWFSLNKALEDSENE